MNERLNVNLQILEELRRYFEAHPDERFCQGLRNIGVVDTVSAVPHEGDSKDLGFVRPMFSNEFYTESVMTLAKIHKRLEER